MFIEPGKRTAELRKFLRNFKYEFNEVPKTQSDYQLTQQGYFKKIEEHQLKVLNKHRREAMKLRDNFESDKKQVESKKKTIFFPKSNSYNEAEKQTAILQRNLAVSQLQAGNFNADALINQIENDFKQGNTDVNGERFHYIKSHNFPGVSLENQLKVMSALKKGFNDLGLSELNEMEKDVEQGQTELAEIKKTFQLG